MRSFTHQVLPLQQSRDLLLAGSPLPAYGAWDYWVHRGRVRGRLNGMVSQWQGRAMHVTGQGTWKGRVSGAGVECKVRSERDKDSFAR